MEKKTAYVFAFLMLICSVSAYTVYDIRPSSNVEGMILLTPPPTYQEEQMKILLKHPFKSYSDVNAYMFIYDSPKLNSADGYDLMVIFEKWRSELQAKERYEGFLTTLWECDEEFKGKRIRICTNPNTPPQVFHALLYQDFFIRVQPYSEDVLSEEELPEYSSEISQLMENTIFQITKLEQNLTRPAPNITMKEIEPYEVKLEQQAAQEIAEEGFFSKYKSYIILLFVILSIIVWLRKIGSAKSLMYPLILVLIILNTPEFFTKGEAITFSIIWTVIYLALMRLLPKKK